MVKADLVNRVSEQVRSLKKSQAVRAVDAMLGALRDSMVRGERIEFRGFGVFQVKPRKRGFGRNPRTGKEVRIPPGRTVRFKPGKELRDLTP
jgi:DNA-binding protein HU-beta